MKIRNVKQSDFPEWLRLRKLLFSEYELADLMNEIRAIYFDKNVVGELDYLVCVVENENSKLCGFCETSLRKCSPVSQHGPIGYVESLFVEANYRQQGLARGMLIESEKWVKKYNCHEFWVDTEERYDKALRLYQNFGFSIVNCHDSEILLTKMLL